MKRKIDEEGEEDTPPEYQSIKCSLKSVIKDDSILENLEENLKLMHKLITRTLLFMKCYYLKYYYDGRQFYDTDTKFVLNVMKIITKKNPQGRPRSEENLTVQNHLQLFSDEDIDLDELKNKKLVAIDPNMGDLLFCVDSDRKDQTKFR